MATTNDGDVVIFYKPGTSLCMVAHVRADNEDLMALDDARWEAHTVVSGEEFARSVVAGTGGKIWIWNGRRKLEEYTSGD